MLKDPELSKDGPILLIQTTLNSLFKEKKMIMITSAPNFVTALRGRRDWARGCSTLLTIIDYLSQFATNKSPIANRISLSTVTS